MDTAKNSKIMFGEARSDVATGGMVRSQYLGRSRDNMPLCFISLFLSGACRTDSTPGYPSVTLSSKWNGVGRMGLTWHGRFWADAGGMVWGVEVGSLEYNIHWVGGLLGFWGRRVTIRDPVLALGPIVVCRIVGVLCICVKVDVMELGCTFVEWVA
ncbi:hypothetical protein Tco_0576250 [Tanacetum coccineum]